MKHPWLAAQHIDGDSLTAEITDPILRHSPGRLWWIALGFSFFLLLVTAAAISWLFINGIGSWGVNTTVVWGYAIASYVWWIAIGSGGTLISSILVLTRQEWRRSINRFAGSMTLFAISIAGIFPILHLGRPAYFYWLAHIPTPCRFGHNGAAPSYGIFGRFSVICCSRSYSFMSAFFQTSPLCVIGPREEWDESFMALSR
jgi:Formate-dependent nitrite reductase, membrane component